MDFSLPSDSDKWEYLFVSTRNQRGAGSTGEGEAGREGADADGHDKDNEGMGSPRSAAGDSPSGRKTAGAADLSLERTLDPPPAWPLEVVIERSEYFNRFPPNGKRTVNYLRAKVDYFARKSQPQAMVMRMILYLDNARKIVSEIHEWFESRKDKMYKRSRFVIQGYFTEFYHSGSVGEVKQWTEYPGKQIFVDYYVNGRLDRMRRREEIIGQKVKEYFDSGRTDRLNFRQVLFSTERPNNEPRTSSYTLPGGGLANDLFISRMVQCFDADASAPSGTDIAKRTFFVTEGRVITQYHYATSKITRNVKVHSHLRAGINSIAGAGDEGGDQDDADGAQEANLMERECYAAIKVSFTQMANLILKRAEVENDVAVEHTVFETALERAEKGELGAMGPEGNAGGDAKAVDYLTPFLRHHKEAAKLTREEALEIRTACLDSLKARLVERANIIQTRLNEENMKLARKQEKFQRSQRDGEVSSEEFEKECTEAIFRIQILEQRLVAQEEAALKKFAELDQRLSNDPRLRVLRNG
jgi:hypothetical protein